MGRFLDFPVFLKLITITSKTQPRLQVLHQRASSFGTRSKGGGTLGSLGCEGDKFDGYSTMSLAVNRLLLGARLLICSIS